MEFEKAIYRVYDRCIDGIRDESSPNQGSRSCRLCEYMTLMLLVFFSATLVCLHVSFVGSPGCLPTLLRNYNSSPDFSFQHDYILQLNVDKAFIDEDMITLTDDNIEEVQHGAPDKFTSALRRRYLLEAVDDANASAVSTNDTLLAYPSYDYEFAYDAAVLSLSPAIRDEHGFKLINLTLTGDQCFGSNWLVENMIVFGGVDVVVLNYVKYSLKHSGLLVTRRDDYFSWGSAEFTTRASVSGYLSGKLSVLLMSGFSFFAISSLTALLVRVLISSGVVILFPVFWLLQALGFRGLLNTRIIALSYPWLGIPMEVLEAARQSTMPFILGHLTRMIVFYVLYQAAQVYFSVIFYNKMFPGPNELWLFALVMIWEYYSMLYVRSLNSIRVFPRLCLFAFLIYHFYRYSFPTGFHSLALFVMFLFSCWSMNHCLQKYEIVAYNRGDVTYDRPRAMYNYLPWPSWNASLPPEFSVFQPLSQRSVGVYQANVPPLHEEQAAAPALQEGARAVDAPVEDVSSTLMGRISGMVGRLFVGGGGGYRRLNERGTAQGDQTDAEAGPSRGGS